MSDFEDRLKNVTGILTDAVLTCLQEYPQDAQLLNALSDITSVYAMVVYSSMMEYALANYPGVPEEESDEVMDKLVDSAGSVVSVLMINTKPIGDMIARHIARNN